MPSIRPSLNLFFFIWQAPKAVQNTIDFTIEGYGKPYSCLEGWCILRLLSGKCLGSWIVFRVYKLSLRAIYLQLEFSWMKKMNFQQRLCLQWPGLRLLYLPSPRIPRVRKSRDWRIFFSSVKLHMHRLFRAIGSDTYCAQWTRARSRVWGRSFAISSGSQRLTDFNWRRL